MRVRAVAEKGLLINEVQAADSSTWDEEATAAQTGTATQLYPTSTANGSAWYHGASKKSNDEAGASQGAVDTVNLIGGAYETLSSLTALTSEGIGAAASAGNNAQRVVMGKAAGDSIGYYVKYTYYLKGAAGTKVDLGTDDGDMNVIIKSVVATPATTNSTNLNKALRVGIKIESGAFYIYAPLAGYTDTYYVAASNTATNPKAGNVPTFTDLAELPAIGSAGKQVDVYVWYEGEDENCKSDYALAAELDDIDIDITFELGSIVKLAPASNAISDTAKNVGGTNYYQLGSSDYYVNQTATAYDSNTALFYKITGDVGEEVVTPAYVLYAA